MKHISLYSLVLISYFSCSVDKKATEQAVITAKEIVYCKCLEYNINNFAGRDTLDISTLLLNEQFDIYGGYLAKSFYPLLDSTAYSILKKEINQQFASSKYESSIGKVSYQIDCLRFYQSKQLDSLCKVIIHKINRDPILKKYKYHKMIN